MPFLQKLFGPPNVEELKVQGDVQGLIKALGYRKDAEVRIAAAEALGETGDAQAVGPLIAFLDENLGALRKVFSRSMLGVHPDKYVPLDHMCEAAVEPLGKLRDERAVGPLLNLIRNYPRGTGGTLWPAITNSLVMIGAPSVEPLIAALDDPLARVCEHAATTLGEMGDKRAVEPLIAALGSDVGALSSRSVKALGELGDKRAVQPLIRLLEAESWVVRMNAAEALGKLGSKRAMKALTVATEDEFGKVREAARRAIREMGG
jgi:HEAT repeat protein